MARSPIDFELVLVRYIKIATACAAPEGVGAGGPHSPEKSQKYRGFSNSGSDPLKNQSAPNVGLSSTRQRDAI